MGRPANKKDIPENESKVNPAAPEDTTQMNTNPAPAAPEENKITNPVKLGDDTVITVKALVPKVYYTCPVTHDVFAWEEVGDTQDMTFKQLKTMKAKYSRYLTDKWILPQNDEAIKKLGLDKVYGEKLTIQDRILLRGNDVDAVAELISKLNNDGRTELARYAEKSAKEGKLVNIKIIRLLEEQLDIELMQLVM